MRFVLLVLAAGILFLATDTPTLRAGENGGSVLGDADCSQSVDALDSLAILRSVADLEPVAGCLDSADVNCDGKVDALDGLGVLRHVAALPPLATGEGCPAIGSGSLALSFSVAPSLVPTTDSLPSFDGEPRPIATLVDQKGTQVDFVENELLIATDDDDVLQAFLARWGGEVVVSAGMEGMVMGGGPSSLTNGLATTHLVRINPELADTTDLVMYLREIDPMSRGVHEVSSDAGLGLIAAAAMEAADGLVVGINFIGHAVDLGDRTMDEAPSSGIAIQPPGCSGGGCSYDPNSFLWYHLAAGSVQDIGVTEAWRALSLAGKLGNKIDIAILDQGFELSADIPPGEIAVSVFPVVPPLNVPGTDDPWHGTKVAQAAMGVPGNNFGTAGPAGPIADAILIYAGYDIFGSIPAVISAGVLGADIINMSYSMPVPATLSFSVIPFELVTLAVRASGVLLFAAAGNDGEDVDAEDCFLVCWEETWHAPCENAGVICVGGLSDNSRARAANSNYGFEWCESVPCDVDIFAPYTVVIGSDPDNPGNIARKGNGTSYSSPYAAGVAALIWAADPGQSAGDVWARMIGFAHTSTDPLVHRYVNALPAVLDAIGNVPPYAQIDAPGDGGTVGYGAFSAVTFVGTMDDYEDGSGCCDASWSSDVDGFMGNGATREFEFTTPGTRIVTLTVTDSDGASNSDSITITAVGSPPTITILSPEAGETLFKGVPYVFEGTSFDPEIFQPLPCGDLTWTSNGPLDTAFPYTGCQPEVTFTSVPSGIGGFLGDCRLITLTGTDADNFTVSDTIAICVAEPPVNAPPIVTIFNPTNNSLLQPGTTITLSGTATDPDTPITYEWAVKYGSTQITLGTGATLSWKPEDDVPFSCGGRAIEILLFATDSTMATGVGMIDSVVAYGIC